MYFKPHKINLVFLGLTFIANLSSSFALAEGDISENAISIPSENLLGGDGSGGGGTHSCLTYSLDKQGHKIIKSGTSELYDLYEARVAHGYNLVNSTGKTANELLNDAMMKIYTANPVYAGAVLDKLKFYTSRKKMLAKKSFNVLNDAHIVFVDQGCSYKQIAQWNDGYNAVVIDSDLYGIFRKSPLNMAALALHEAVYAVERASSGVKDSDKTRKLVGQAFSDARVDLIKKVNNVFHIKAGHFYSWILKALDGQSHAIVNVGSWQDKLMKTSSVFRSTWTGKLSTSPDNSQVASMASPVEISNGTVVIEYGFYQSEREVESPLRIHFQIYEDARLPVYSRVISKNELDNNGRVDGNLVLALPYETAMGQTIDSLTLD